MMFKTKVEALPRLCAFFAYDPALWNTAYQAEIDVSVGADNETTCPVSEMPQRIKVKES